MSSDELDPAHRATHDDLTGLPTRFLLVERIAAELARMQRQPGTAAVAVVRLDEFAELAERLSPRAIDELVGGIAGRLAVGLRPTDLLARTGADELGLLVDAGTHPDVILRVARRLHRSLEEPFTLASTQVAVPLRVTVSIGAAIGEQADVDPEDLLHDATAACERAAAAGGGGTEILDERLRRAMTDRLDREDDLHRALRRAELRLRYQPVVDTMSGEVIGAEALLRWQHASQLDGADSFIDLAEGTGLIVPMGQWVLDEAWTQLRGWCDLRPGRRFDMHVNLSSRQLADDEMVESVAALPALPDPAKRLCVEVREATIAEADDEVLDRLRRLRALGARVFVDDFGTESMSFAAMRQLPIDGIKIDRSFVAGLDQAPPDTDIVGAIVDVAHRFGLEVAAQGVETAEQLAVLRGLGCDAAQGYLFARPLTADDLDGLLRGRAPSRAG